MPSYRMTVDFISDRLLTEAELDGIGFSVQVQIEEPQLLVYADEEAEETGDGEWVEAEWSSSHVSINTVEIDDPDTVRHEPIS